MSLAYASIHIRALDPELSVKLLVPIDVVYFFENITWIWHHDLNDAFPIGLSTSNEYSFRFKARLFNGMEVIEENKIYDFRKCNREDYINSLGNLKLT